MDVFESIDVRERPKVKGFSVLCMVECVTRDETEGYELNPKSGKVVSRKTGFDYFGDAKDFACAFAMARDEAEETAQVTHGKPFELLDHGAMAFRKAVVYRVDAAGTWVESMYSGRPLAAWESCVSAAASMDKSLAAALGFHGEGWYKLDVSARNSWDGYLNSSAVAWCADARAFLSFFEDRAAEAALFTELRARFCGDKEFPNLYVADVRGDRLSKRELKFWRFVGSDMAQTHLKGKGGVRSLLKEANERIAQGEEAEAVVAGIQARMS